MAIKVADAVRVWGVIQKLWEYSCNDATDETTHSSPH